MSAENTHENKFITFLASDLAKMFFAFIRC